MTGRDMLVQFEDLIRTTNKDLEFDVTINTDLVYSLLTRAELQYIIENFLISDSVKDNINAVRRHSDIFRNIIKRTTATVGQEALGDGGYSATFDEDDYWMFMSGIIKHPDFPRDDRGFGGGDSSNPNYASSSSMWPKIELDLINHFDLQKKVRTTKNEPVYKHIPIVLEGTNNFVFYLDKERSAIDTTSTIVFEIIYLAKPAGISEISPPSLSYSTHTEIVKLAVDIFLKEYKFLLGSIQKQ